MPTSFQFIGFPSEWGVDAIVTRSDGAYVSNLLGSPASGETPAAVAPAPTTNRFQFIGFPSEWGADFGLPLNEEELVFPIYWVPQRVGSFNKPFNKLF